MAVPKRKTQVKKEKKPKFAGTTWDALKVEVMPLPPPGKVASYFLTCAQNNTKVQSVVWRNVLALRDYYTKDGPSRLFVSRFTYNRGAYERRNPGVKSQAEIGNDALYYDALITPYICDHRVDLAPDLTFCGEQDMSPTLVWPLSRFKSYTGPQSAIYPHTKLAVESVPTYARGAKFNYTTGTVTQQNYVQRTAGLKAAFHHTYGAALVEVDHTGAWWVRQLNCDRAGTIYDLDVKVENGKVSHSPRVAAINWGDLHVEEKQHDVYAAAFDEGGMLDTLRPSHQFAHDVSSFSARNHHDIKNSRLNFEKYALGVDNVRDEMQRVVQALNVTLRRPWCKTVVVDSNHDDALDKWLDEADYKKDPVNARFFLRVENRRYEAIENREDNWHTFEWVMRDMGVNPDVLFLRPGDDYRICTKYKGGIQCGMHGHEGPNGARGTPANLSEVSDRANTGHTHTAGARGGLFTAATSSRLKLRYTGGGPSSWSHSHVATYLNSKRTIVTMRAGKWRAKRGTKGPRKLSTRN